MREQVRLMLWLAVVAACVVGGAVALSLNSPHSGLQYEQEWVRALLQAGLVAVVGIVTSAVLERFKDALQQRRDISKLRFDVLTDLSRTYMDVKLARRKLQASNAFTAADVDQLNQLQVLVELHKRNSIRVFRQNSELKGHLRTMEQYLNKVANDRDSPQRVGFFSGGFDVFADAYEKAATLIRGEIAGQ